MCVAYRFALGRVELMAVARSVLTFSVVALLCLPYGKGTRDDPLPPMVDTSSGRVSGYNTTLEGR